jgi:lysophospholipase L1-like esterase
MNTVFIFRTVLFSSLFMLSQAKCRPETEPVPPVVPQPEVPEQVDILALGDSYTIGESVGLEKNFPAQLRDSLAQRGFTANGLRIVAKTGWRSDNLVTALGTNANKDIQDSIFSVVTLCIGVNDQYQNRTVDSYRPIFEQLLQTAIARAGGKIERVFVLSIPDWYYTPYGQNYPSPAGKISTDIDAFNAANRQITESYGVTYINVTEVSRRGLAMPELVAQDGLHPSAAQYKEWVRQLAPLVAKALKK